MKFSREPIRVQEVYSRGRAAEHATEWVEYSQRTAPVSKGRELGKRPEIRLKIAPNRPKKWATEPRFGLVSPILKCEDKNYKRTKGRAGIS